MNATVCIAPITIEALWGFVEAKICAAKQLEDQPLRQSPDSRNTDCAASDAFDLFWGFGR
jgi:hypothetical protein